jgi:protein phosphatase
MTHNLPPDHTDLPHDELPEPFSSDLAVDVFAVSDLGHVRPNNEDHFLVARVGRALETLFSNLHENAPGLKFAEAGYAMVVADGVGGQPAGEIASSQAIFTLLNLALRTPDWQFRWGAKEKNTVMWRAQDRFRRVNEALLQEATAHSALQGMCTTMTMALSHGKHLIVSHVGDSRASLLHKGKLKRLTRDHTLVAQLLHEGALASDDPLVVGFKGALLQAVGGSDNELRPDVDYYELTEGDQLLLCTDGLTDMVDDDLIASVLSESASAELACNTLVKLALANGGLDNITVIVARYSMPEDERRAQ